MDVTRKGKDDLPRISLGGILAHYFHSLHSNKPLNPAQQIIFNELQQHESQKEQLCSLGYLITKKEILIAAKRLKTNNSSFSDKIKNEMIKASLHARKSQNS